MAGFSSRKRRVALDSSGSSCGPPMIQFISLEGISKAQRCLSKPSGGQRSNDRIKGLTSIVWLELYLQATLSAIQEYARLGHGCFVDDNRNTLLLCEGTDSANMVAGQPFGVGWTHHRCTLAVECRSQLFHADFTIRRDDDTDWLVVDLSHKGLQDPPRLYADGGSGLKANAFPVGIVVVPVEGKIYASLVQRKSSACALRHDDMVPVPFHSLHQACAQLNLRSRQ